jgi:hypothetical protein
MKIRRFRSAARTKGTNLMADLENSKRISYKAIYNQISPTATTGTSKNSPTKSLSRAIEKTAFVQSLRITPQELAGIKDQLSGRDKVPAKFSPICQRPSEPSRNLSTTTQRLRR